VNEVSNLIKSLDSSTSSGFSKIRVTILQKAVSSLAEPLTKLFNKCIDANKYPTNWKTAIVTPVFKKGDSSDLNNYRDILILPPLNKVFSSQHGFRSQHSCESALHEIISACFENRDNKLITLLCFIDFKKAFDMVDPNLLLIKLLNYGCSNSNDYFKNRKIQTKVGSRCTTRLNIRSATIYNFHQ
jgi:hypothetical protein